MYTLFVACVLGLAPVAPSQDSPESRRAAPESTAVAPARPEIVTFAVSGLSALALDDVPTASPVEVGATYDRERVVHFGDEILLALADAGYLAAKVAEPSVTRVDGGVRVELAVTEGAVYQLGEVRVREASAVSPDEIRAALGVRPGQRLTKRAVDEWIEHVRERYYALGYSEAEVAVRAVAHAPAERETEGRMDLDVDLYEGLGYVMGDFRIEGRGGLDLESMRATASPLAGEPFDDIAFQRALVRASRALGYDSSYLPDYHVDFDKVTRRANVTLYGLKRVSRDPAPASQ